MTFAATVLTLYPEMFPGPLGVSLAGRARDEGKWSLDTVQIRDFAIDRHRTVDDTPAGGGAGMVLRVDVLQPLALHASALHHTVADLFEARTSPELVRRKELIVHLDVAHRGVGTASCGPDVLPQYRLTPGRYEFAYRLSLR